MRDTKWLIKLYLCIDIYLYNIGNNNSKNAMNLRENVCGGDNINGIGERKKKQEVIVVVWKKIARKESGHFY